MSKKLIYSIMFLISGISLNFLSKKVLFKGVTKEEYSPMYDLLYNYLPYIPEAIYLAEFLIILSIVIFIYFIVKKKYHRKNLHHYFFMIGIFQFMRGLMILLNPTKQVGEVSSFLGILNNIGMFPSGHISLPFFFYLFLFKNDRKWSIFLLIISLIVGLLLIISRVHYSIDILGSLFIAFSITTIYEKYVMKNAQN